MGVCECVWCDDHVNWCHLQAVGVGGCVVEIEGFSSLMSGSLTAVKTAVPYGRLTWP